MVEVFEMWFLFIARGKQASLTAVGLLPPRGRGIRRGGRSPLPDLSGLVGAANIVPDCIVAKTESFSESEPGGGFTATLLMYWSLVEPATGEAGAQEAWSGSTATGTNSAPHPLRQQANGAKRMACLP